LSQRAEWPGVSADALGPSAVLSVDRALYTDTAIFKAAYWFADRFYVFLDVDGDMRISVELRPKGDAQGTDLAAAAGEFCNSLVDFRVREAVLRETSGVRDALVARAFSEGAGKPGLPGALSDERHVAAHRNG
jgi:His-Xaa-Ser system protein HxsD